MAISIGKYPRRDRSCLCRKADPGEMASPDPGAADPVGRYPLFMVDSIVVSLLIGCLLGFLAGLGVGGGTLLILWLTLVLDMDPGTARVINLMFFITAAGSVSIVRLHQKTVPWKKILPAIIVGCIMAFVFSGVSKIVETTLLKKLFGGLLLITGLRELFYRP